MAYLDRQRDSFANNLASAAAKITVKRPPTTAAAVAATTAATTTAATPASPTPSVASTASATAATPAVYSQPENTGVGAALGTNIVYALDYLKKEGGRPVSLAAVLRHLNLDREPEAFQKQVVARMRHHPRITWRPDDGLLNSSSTAASTEENEWKTGTYEHKPIIPHVKDRTALLQYLQRRTDAQGVNVKDLKDGWPDCEAALAALEREHRVLVVRTKKDNHPRMVWLDDPTLCRTVEPEFQALWHRVDVPPLDDIVRKLAAAGQKPTSEDPRLRRDALAAGGGGAANRAKQKKRAQRRTGKSTNTHMEHLLKDYSHLKR
ncbi:transcription initiation factor beta [Niveomyces insectorum RCEF 264]|uniref:Transcription initiation factor IIE subunit beta n=1 Tax=Niveomyces insectorum RCEF 264 TaxID=1081102 RepID=A0A162J894_9HYPO|nr:transcription initiation factor beta [Niveomyces insectorum RCEF 264]